MNINLWFPFIVPSIFGKIDQKCGLFNSTGVFLAPFEKYGLRKSVVLSRVQHVKHPVFQLSVTSFFKIFKVDFLSKQALFT